MVRCAACQHENAPPAKFCGECGARLERACPRCGMRNPPGNKFCAECGERLAPETGVAAARAPSPDAGVAAARAPAPQAGVAPARAPAADEAGAAAGGGRVRSTGGPPVLKDAAPASYTPRHLAEKILTSRSALEGERKTVTVLFCDLQGSTALAERIGPERMHELLNRFFELALTAVHRYEGTVNQFLGDGFMALFGAPVAHEDHALRAAFAALEIRRSLGALNAELAARGAPLHLRMGINTGPVVVGGIGDNLRMDYTAVGDTTNLAARLQSLAQPDTLLAGEGTHELIRSYFECTPLGAMEVKGKAHPVPVFRVERARERRTRFDLSLEHGLTGLVGRQLEMGLLKSRWTEAAAGRGQAVVLIGEAGVGKSRLLFEFKQSLPPDAQALEGRCLPYETGVSYAPVVEILRRLFAIDQDRPEAAREKIHAGVGRLGPELRDTLPFLLNLLSPSPESGALATLESGQVKRLTHEAVTALLLAASRPAPLFLAVEDYHWSDQSSKELLARLIPSLSGARVLLCLATRPGETISVEGRTAVTQIALNPLSDGEVIAVAGQLAGGALPPEVQELLVKKTGGYPLYVEELLRSLLDKGQLVRTESGLGVRGALSETEVPDTIHDIITARIDRLEGEVKRTLHLASVVGEEFDFPLLQAVAEASPAELLGRLDQLKAQEFVDEIALFPRRRYAFRHGLVREVAYGSLLQRRRSEWHGLVGAALERLAGDAIEDHLPALAEHYARSANRENALHYLMRAGDRATRQYAASQAQAYWEQALGLVDSGPDDSAVRRQLLDRLGDAHFAQGDLNQALAAWRKALELALDDRRATAELNRKIGVTHWSLGDPDTAIARLTGGLESLAGEGDCLEGARLYQELGRISFHLGRHDEATRWAEKALALGERLGAPDVVSHASNTLGLALARAGEIERGAEAVKESLETALAHELSSAACRAYANLAVLYATIDQDRSAAYCAEGLTLAMRIGDLIHQSWLQCILAGRSCSLAGDYEEGVRAARASIELDRRLGQKSHLPIPLIILAQIHQCHGEFRESERYYQEALALAQELGGPQLLIPCYDGLATLAIERGDEVQAERYLERSQRLMEETGWASDSLLVLPFLT